MWALLTYYIRPSNFGPWVVKQKHTRYPTVSYEFLKNIFTRWALVRPFRFRSVWLLRYTTLLEQNPPDLLPIVINSESSYKHIRPFCFIHCRNILVHTNKQIGPMFLLLKDLQTNQYGQIRPFELFRWWILMRTTYLISDRFHRSWWEWSNEHDIYMCAFRWGVCKRE